MRLIELCDGSKVEVKPLTRKQLRDGKKYGLGSLSFKIEPDLVDDTIDYVLGTQFNGDVLDGLPNPDLLKLHSGIMAETYGVKDEEKNLPTSGPGDQTGTGSNDATSAEAGNK